MGFMLGREAREVAERAGREMRGQRTELERLRQRTADLEAFLDAWMVYEWAHWTEAQRAAKPKELIEAARKVTRDGSWGSMRKP